MKTRIVLLSVLAWFMALPLTAQQPVSKSFEVRYFSKDRKANGETDFKGKTAVFDTDQRVEFLGKYAEYARKFFNDPNLDTKAVTNSEVSERLAAIKSAPLPKVRTRIPLHSWRWTGYKEGQHEESRQSLNKWDQSDRFALQQGALLVKSGETVNPWRFPSQSWRFSLTWKAKVSQAGDVRFTFSDNSKLDALTVGFSESGHFLHETGKQEVRSSITYQPDAWYTFKIEFDLSAEKGGSYNFYIDNQLIADYIRLDNINIRQVNQFLISNKAPVMLDDVWGVGYHPTHVPKYPYTIETFLDENFEEKSPVKGWNAPGYNDSTWRIGSLPIVHGSERHGQEDLYMRKQVKLDDFDKAFLNIEMLDPGGEVWINGRLAATLSDTYPARLDITNLLHRNRDNLLAVKVNHFYLTDEIGKVMTHSLLDYNLGWFAGRMSLDLTGDNVIEDAFAYTETTSDPAQMRLKVTLNNHGKNAFRGKFLIKASPWYPQESGTVAEIESKLFTLIPGDTILEQNISIPDPRLWTCETPNLYKLEVILTDADGNPVDDYVLTSGIRTVDQTGGTFRLNGKPAMLNGAQIMGFKGPVENLATWLRCSPPEWVMRELLMVKNMNGNLLRIHVHGWMNKSWGINDPRYAEMADQLGIMLIWSTPAWIRQGTSWKQIDFVGYPRYMRQVRNHPSIVMWEGANHTHVRDLGGVEESNAFCEAIYNTIYPVDPSRIISLQSYILWNHYRNDAGTIGLDGNPIVPSPAWTAPRVTRGNQDAPTGYGNEWSVLRNWPNDYRKDLLNSKERAYFNFEHEESIGQPNWNLVKGKPWYRMQSYEWIYDERSIGRRLTVDEWRESQAWQAFSAWESMKKQRWLDYDGFSWCCLHGGANSGTYKKPLIDIAGHAKLSYWVNKMVFQNTIAGSYNVDVVYGPDDMLEPVIIHLGKAETYDLIVRILDENSQLVDKRVFTGIQLEAGRSKEILPKFRPDVKKEGYYIFEYELK